MNLVTVKNDLTIGLRDATPEDEAVIMRAWLVGFRDMGDWPQRVEERRYFDLHKLTVQKLLAASRTLVACNVERSWQVLGFICWAGPKLHWLYTKRFMRRNGIAGELWRRAGQPTKCSHWTLGAEELLRERWGLRYDPFLLEGK